MKNRIFGFALAITMLKTVLHVIVCGYSLHACNHSRKRNMQAMLYSAAVQQLHRYYESTVTIQPDEPDASIICDIKINSSIDARQQLRPCILGSAACMPDNSQQQEIYGI